ncbi:hypothetical protein WJ0W_001304 [Paenibacillus melissococcoides]|uniref:Uncharacterized protein n=1 Tax=Paenibacillus melissococcoides TaxID=2912268 RepID=A0ABN8U3C9_9BACL|nr:hypothetical protein WJ0W_001304 [Paenibacillus melissococcoides]
MKAIIGEIDALLQEFHQIVEQMVKIPAFTQDFAASSIFRSHCPRCLSHFPISTFRIRRIVRTDFPASTFAAVPSCPSLFVNDVWDSPFFK